jgi:hypothetical protein
MLSYMNTTNATGERIAGQDSAPAVNALSGHRLGAVEAVGARYDVSPRTIFRWADIGLIPAGVKISAARRWDLDEIDRHIAAGCPRIRSAKGGPRR